MTEQATDTAAAVAIPAPASEAATTPASEAQVTTEATGTDTTAEATAAGATTEEFSLPDEYKDKPWAEKIKSQEDAYKQIENLTALVGKKTIQAIDYETASPEDIEAYHASLAPENGAEGYSWGEESMPEITKPMADIMLKAGINSHQQKLIAEGFDGLIGQIAGDRMEADTSAEGYNAMMKESFGDDYEKIAGTIEATLKEHILSDDDKKVFDGVDNKTRVAMDRAIHSLMSKYEDRIKAILEEHGATESGAQAEGGEGGVQSATKAEQRSKIRAEMRANDGTINGHVRNAVLQQQLNKLM